MNIYSRLIGAAATLAVLSGLTPQLLAQNADVLDEIIVTAQKKEQNLQDVPVSVGVLRGESLDVVTSGGEDILALSARIPSVYAESSFGRTFPRFYIRGLGNTDFDLNANNPVSFVYDGVVLENPVLKGFPIFDLDRVEALRGPQGTLFGRNTPAGTIKFESVKPSSEFGGYGRLSLANFGSLDAEGAVGGALNDSDTLSARLSLLFQTRDDYVDNTFDGPIDAFEEYRELAGRLQFLYEPTADFSALLNIHARDLDGGSRVFRANVINPGTGGIVAGTDRERAAQDGIQYLDVRNEGVSLTMDYNVGSGVLTSITAAERVYVDARGDVDGGFGAAFLGNDPAVTGPGFIPFPAESSDSVDDHLQLSQELRYAWSPVANVDATIGGYLFSENLELENVSYDSLAPGNPLNGLALQEQDTFSAAIFGSAEVAVTDLLTITAGLRLTTEQKDFTARRVIGPFGSGTLGPVTRNLDDTVVSGDFAANYALTDEASIYARYARGFRAPNVQGRIVFGDVVTVADTEIIDSIEAGYKSTFLDNRARLNATVFAFKTQDQQLTAVGGGGNFNQLLNADSVNGYGVELDGELNPITGLNLTAGYSYNNTEIDDADLEVGICGAPCTVLDPINAVTGNALINGNSLPQSPEHIANFTARYGVPINNGLGELFIFTDIAYRSEINFFLYESAEFNSDALTETGLRVGYVHGDGDWEVAAFGRNIFDEVALEGAVDFNNFTGFLNEPAIYGVEASKRF